MKYYYLRFLALLHYTLSFSLGIQAQSFAPDSTFQVPLLRSQQVDVRVIVKQLDGKILVGGSFDFATGTSSTNLIRLYADGTLDNTFFPSLKEKVNCLGLQSDGKLLVGSNSLIRLNKDGSVDITFNGGTPFGYFTKAIALQEDGKILVGADIKQADGSIKPGLIRLNTDGSIDANFNAAAALGLLPNSIAIQADGKVLIGGMDYLYPQNTYLLRLNTDGSLDNSFLGKGPRSEVLTIVIQPDNKILVGGNFSHVNDLYKVSLVRLHPDGSVDNSFDVAAFKVPQNFSRLNTIALQADGKIVVGGEFLTQGKEGVLRVNSDGSLDHSFTATVDPFGKIYTLGLLDEGQILLGGAYKGGLAKITTTGDRDATFPATIEKRGSIHQIQISSKGKIVIAGDFNTINGKPSHNVARLLPNGSLDETFNAPVNIGTVRSIALLEEEKVLVASPIESPHKRVILLREDGMLDNTFIPANALDPRATYILALQADGKIMVCRTSGGFVDNPSVFRLQADGNIDNTFTGSKVNGASILTLQADGKILVGGGFSTFAGLPLRYLVRLHSGGQVDQTFNAGINQASAIYSITLQPDEKIIIASRAAKYKDAIQPTLFRLQSDGSLDTSFKNNFEPGLIAYSTHLQADEKILTHGFFTKAANFSLARVETDGTIDSSFSTSGIADQSVSSFTIPSTKVLLVALPGKLLQLTARQSQTIIFPSIADKLITDSPFRLNATASSNLPVTYSVVSGPATISENMVTLTGTPGSVTIRASQAGNTTYTAAADIEMTFKVEAVLGVEELEENIKMYPNPFQEDFLVELPRSIVSSRLQIYNAQGQLINASIKVVPSGYQVKLNQVSPGLYVFHLHTIKGSIIKKIILQ